MENPDEIMVTSRLSAVPKVKLIFEIGFWDQE
jgi:hypothetical protein